VSLVRDQIIERIFPYRAVDSYEKTCSCPICTLLKRKRQIVARESR